MFRTLTSERQKEFNQLLIQAKYEFDDPKYIELEV